VRIGLVCPYAWDVPGGVRTHVSDLALTLAEGGHEVSVLAPAEDPSALPSWVVDGGRPVALPYNGSVAKVTLGFRTTRRIRSWIREGAFDVLHVHEPVAPGLSLIALWAANGPMVGTWHSSTSRSRILSAGYYVAQTAMEKLSGRIAVSEDARRTLVAHVGGDAVLIPNGVRVADYAPCGRHPAIEAGRPSILFLGRIDEPRKGLDVLTSALPSIIDQVPELQVIVAGPGDAQDRHQRLDPRIAGHVTFLGRLSDQDKVRALRSVDLYVAPHTGGESFGIVLIEAMAAQAPVLASDLPAFRRVLQDGQAGRLFPTEDASALANEAVALLRDPPARQALVEQGSRRVRSFDWASVVSDVLAVYEAVTVTGEPVTEDLRGQIVGRLGSRGG